MSAQRQQVQLQYLLCLPSRLSSGVYPLLILLTEEDGLTGGRFITWLGGIPSQVCGGLILGSCTYSVLETVSIIGVLYGLIGIPPGFLISSWTYSTVYSTVLPPGMFEVTWLLLIIVREPLKGGLMPEFEINGWSIVWVRGCWPSNGLIWEIVYFLFTFSKADSLLIWT